MSANSGATIPRDVADVKGEEGEAAKLAAEILGSRPDLPLMLSADRAAAELGLHRKTVYAEIRAGRLGAKRYGRRVLIPREALAEFAASLETV